MSGTWEKQNKVLPGAYINFISNKPLAITPGERGIVTMPLELSVGKKGDVYVETLLSSGMKERNLSPTEADYLPIHEALKNASKVIVYNLGSTAHTAEDVTAYLDKMLIEDFDTMAYIYSNDEVKTAIITWVKNVIKNEGKAIQGVLANVVADTEAIINVGNGVILSDGTELTPEKCCAWVAGATSGAKINESLTNFKYAGAIDVKPRLTKTQQEAAVNAGKFIFKSNFSQTVTCLYDINSLTTFNSERSKDFRKNRVVRVLNNINNDVTEIFESNYMGKINNNDEGRSLVRGSIISYMNELQSIGAIQNFVADDVQVNQGTEIDAMIIDCYVQTVDSAEKFYITVNVK